MLKEEQVGFQKKMVPSKEDMTIHAVPYLYTKLTFTSTVTFTVANSNRGKT